MNAFSLCRWRRSSGDEQPLVLALLPLDPRLALRLGAGEPRLDGGAKRAVASQAERERELAELDAVLAPEAGKRVQLVQLEDAVQAVAPARPHGDDEAGALEIAEHPGRPARAGRRFADGEPVHGRNLNTGVSIYAAVPVLETHDVVEVRRRYLEHQRV